jgi:leucyl-tRNA---protein transferase
LCVPIRVPVDRFKPNKSQRRCQRRNADLISTVGPPVFTSEKHDLYIRYLAARHSGAIHNLDQSGFESFLYESPVDTIEICHRDATDRLLGVGICDISSRSLSTVYFYFEPAEQKRGLGTFGALYEIELARQRGIPNYYLGYWVNGCRAMEYKTSFRPYEILDRDGNWREY